MGFDPMLHRFKNKGSQPDTKMSKLKLLRMVFMNKNNYDNMINYMIWESFNFHFFYFRIYSTSKLCHLFRKVLRGQSMNYGNTLLSAVSILHSFYFLPKMYHHLIYYMTGFMYQCVHSMVKASTALIENKFHEEFYWDSFLLICSIPYIQAVKQCPSHVR